MELSQKLFESRGSVMPAQQSAESKGSLECISEIEMQKVLSFD